MITKRAKHFSLKGAFGSFLTICLIQSLLCHNCAGNGITAIIDMVPVRYVAESFGKKVNYTRGIYETKVTVD